MKTNLNRYAAAARKMPALLMFAFCLIAFNDKGIAFVAGSLGWGLLLLFWPVPKTAK